MKLSIDDHAARNAFNDSLKAGKRDTGLLERIRGKDNRLLPLSQVLSSLSAGSETYLGVREVEVERIVGTENRSDDFSRDFHPLNRSFEQRWIAVYLLLSRGELNDAIRLIELGERYFVRDGHHRVSTAKALGIDFLTAEISSYPLPYSLPEGMDWNYLPLMREKDRFHQSTGAFDVLGEGEFYVACPETWRWLEKEICEYNRAWFIRRFDREPESIHEQLNIWYENLYRNSIEYIRCNSLAYLFPGKRETDIFVDMIRLWNSFEYPDSMWLGEIYALLLRRGRRKRLLRAALQFILSIAGSVLMSPDEEYRRFAGISQIEELVPDFRPLPRVEGFFGFLYRRLIYHYAPALKKEYGRAPYIQELTPRWYREFYAPVAAEARRRNSALDQVRFYKGFSRRYLVPLLEGRVEIREALSSYAESTAVQR